MSKRGFSRRAFLRGAGGISIALPLFASLQARAQGSPPKRFIAFYQANGVFTSEWFPQGSESSFTLGATQTALQPFFNQLLWVNNIDMAVAVNGFGEQHQRGLGAWLTGASLLAGNFVGNDGTMAGWANGISIDQELVSILGAGSKAPSMQLGVHAAERDVSGVVSYSGPSMPLLAQDDPTIVFQNMFADIATPPATLEVLRRQRKSVLDTVIDQISSLESTLAVTERAQLDQHLTMVRDLEVRVTAVSNATAQPQTCTQATPPAPLTVMDVMSMPDVSKMQIDLLVLALTCDLTRIATLMYSDAKDHIALPFINIESDVHNITHLSDADPTRAQLATRDQWQSQQMAYLLGQLQAVPSGQGTLLDQTLVFWGSEISVGNTHSHASMPFMFAGGGAGWRMGRNLSFAHQPHNTLLLTILQSFGGTEQSFGDANFNAGTLSGFF